MLTGLNIITLISWGSAVIGVVGVTGLILLFIFAPALATVAITAVKDFISLMSASRLGVGIMVGVACLSVGYLYGDHLGRVAEDAKYVEAQKKADEEAKKRDQTIGAQANADAQNRIKALEKSNAAYAAKINAYTKVISANAKTGACLLSADDVRRLR